MIFLTLSIICMFEAWMCYWFAATIVNKKIPYTIPRIALIVVGVLVVGILSAFGGNIMFSLNDIWIVMLIIAIVWMLLVFRTCLVQVIELVVIYYSAFALLDFFFAFVFMHQMDPYLVQLNYSGWSGWNVGVYWLARLTMFAVLLVLKRLLPKDFLVKDCKLVFGLTALGLLLLAAFYQYVFELSVDVMLAQSHQEVRWYLLAVSALAILAIVYGVFILFLKTKTAQRESDIFKIQNDMQKKQFYEVQQVTEKNQGMVHDVRNHFLVLQELAKNKDTEGVEKYLQKITSSDLMTPRTKWTGCKILDLILEQKKQEAKGYGIDFEIVSTGTVRMGLREDALVSLFGNLLDNAIEACQKIVDSPRRIRTTIERKNEMVYINVSNTVAEQPMLVDGIPVSTKKEKDIHGYGFKNIKNIVDRAGGTLLVKGQDDTFTVQIMLFDSQEDTADEKENRNTDYSHSDHRDSGLGGQTSCKFWALRFFSGTTSLRTVEKGTEKESGRGRKEWIALIVILVLITIVVLRFNGGGHAVSIWKSPDSGIF
ncbi:MAG: sensor histidine kinase [Eubacterium sp.]|nr:sensor histidine kinase [Eubacterium sp.]